MRKLDMAAIAESAQKYNTNAWSQRGVEDLQVIVFTMCGGGMLGHFAATQPADFYIDDRCGRLPFGKREIYQAVQVLETIAKAKGMDVHNLPWKSEAHGCGIF